MYFVGNSIIITSNRSPSEWPDLFGNPLIASAALDRLTHHARISVITGESYRQKHRKKSVVAQLAVGEKLSVTNLSVTVEGGEPDATTQNT